MNARMNSDAALRKLREADALLAEGVQRIMGVAHDIPGASEPLQEALRLTEQQAMATLDAASAAQRRVDHIEATATGGGWIDAHIQGLRDDLRVILTSQQAQDLAGQRLKKVIALLQAVEQRVQDALGGLGDAPVAAGVPVAAPARLAQDDVDDLLASLGI